MTRQESSGGAVELPSALGDRRRHALRDLEELAEQVAAGEIDEETASTLQAGYEDEIATVERLAAGSAPAAPLEGRSTQRAVVGALILIGSLTVIILLAAQVFRSDDPPPSQSPSDAATLDAGALEDMEAIVAAHPDSVGMRLALADLYFEQGVYSSAIDHYLAATEGELTPEEESRTLGRIGWMAYSTGQLDPAVEFLHMSLEADPDYDEGKLFLAMVLFEGFGDAGGALVLFDQILALPDLNDEMRSAVEAAAEEARAALEVP
ncbi:MAG: hypothetical protein OEP52_01700 [Acidimicrobiia bacterium]|nr:hypothetical protein [Acidimicrobiia bacterium]